MLTQGITSKKLCKNGFAVLRTTANKCTSPAVPVYLGVGGACRVCEMRTNVEAQREAFDLADAAVACKSSAVAVERASGMSWMRRSGKRCIGLTKPAAGQTIFIRASFDVHTRAGHVQLNVTYHQNKN